MNLNYLYQVKNDNFDQVKFDQVIICPIKNRRLSMLQFNIIT